MKHLDKLLAIILGGALMASCSQADDDPASLAEPVPVSFSARIGEGGARAAGTEWAAGDAIGVSATSGDRFYDNVRYSTPAGDGLFEAAGDRISYNSTSPVTFTAYYPYDSAIGGGDGVISASTADQSRPSALYFLWAQASGSYSDPDVVFNFTPRMSRITIVVASESDIDLSGACYAVEGLVLDGTFDTATGEAWANDGRASGAIQGNLTQDRTASVIVFPQTAPRMVLKLYDPTTNVEYSCVLTPGELESGMNYTVNITVKNFEMSVASTSITPWTSTDLPGLEAGVVLPIGDKDASEAAVGDFYMKDGSLVDKSATLTERQNAACIGIVFTTDGARIGEGAKAALAARGIAPHGLVMSVTDVTEGKKWGPAIDEEGLSHLGTLKKMYEGVEGYSETQWILNNHPDQLASDYPVFYHISLFGKADDTAAYAAPDKSSGWFLPSVGNWWDILRNLGQVSALDGYRSSSDASVVLANSSSQAADNINSAMSQLKNASLIVGGDYFWTSSEWWPYSACWIGFYKDGKLAISSFSKGSSYNLVRAVLAF